jgi:putative membrane protein
MEDKKSLHALKCNDHLANQRTFLAWIRTSLGIMAFGFVVERFALFLKQITLILDKSTASQIFHHRYTPSYSTYFGIAVICLGVLMGALSFINYKRVQRQIDEDKYRPSTLLNVMLVLLVLLIGVFLLYLIYTI